MITLHYFPGNASFTPHLLLNELGVPFELSLVDRANNAHKSPAYLKINPAGQVPAPIDGDFCLAESLAITYGDRGIQVSVVCPQYVATAIIGASEDTAAGSLPGVLTVDQAATAIGDGIEQGRFLILTHPEVLGFFQRKASDYERWLGGMRRLRDGLRSGGFLKTKS